MLKFYLLLARCLELPCMNKLFKSLFIEEKNVHYKMCGA